MARLTHVPGMLRKIEALKPIVAETEGIYHTFKSDAPTIQKALRQVRKTGGDYTLVELVDSEAARYGDRPPKKVARDSYFGTMQDETVVRSCCKFLVELRKYEQWLLSCATCEDETAAMDMTIGLLMMPERRLYRRAPWKPVIRRRHSPTGGCVPRMPQGYATGCVMSPYDLVRLRGHLSAGSFSGESSHC